MSRRLLIVMSIGIFLTSPLIGQVKIFVAPNGKDGATGTIDQPLASLQQAILNVRKISAEKIDIILRKGIYYHHTTIVLNTEGIAGKKINITSFNNETVVTRAGRKLRVTWKKFSYKIYGLDDYTA